MRKEVYLNAGAIIFEMAEAMENEQQTKEERETQRLFFWLLDKIRGDVHYKQYTGSSEESIYKLEVHDWTVNNNWSTLNCEADHYNPYLVTINKEFREIVKKVADIFNSMKGYSAEYNPYGRKSTPILKVYMKVEKKA